jgi:hypothetical protein
MALAVCVVFVLALALSSAFIFANADHEHDHNGADGGCTTCTRIAVAAEFLAHISAPIVAIVAVIGVLFSAAALLKFAAPRFDCLTLIGLKIRLNI